jgi:hypothetical protein
LTGRGTPANFGVDETEVDGMLKGEALLAAALVLLTGLGCRMCSESGSDTETTASITPPPSSSSARGQGLAAPGNDPALVELAQNALTCEWGTAGFKYSCKAAQAWTKSGLMKDGKTDRTLVAMLGDSRAPVRWLAAKSLVQNGREYSIDAALAARVITAAAAETDVVVAEPIGSAAGKVDVSKTGLRSELRRLASSHPLPKLRAAVVGRAQTNNREAMFDFTVRVSKDDPDASVRRAAIDALWIGTPADEKGAACDAWLDRMSADPSSEVAGKAAFLLLSAPRGQCRAQWDAALSVVEARAAGGTAQDGNWGGCLPYFYDQDQASAAQRSRAEAIAKQMVENTANSGVARSRAITFVGRKSPDGKAYILGFKEDPDYLVKSVVERMLGIR